MEQAEKTASEMIKEFEEKIQYAQHIITILQTRLNESVGQNVQFEATITMLKDEKEKLKQIEDSSKEKLIKESVDGSNNKTEKK